MDEREIEIRSEMLGCKHFNGIGGFLPGFDEDENGEPKARWDDAKTCEAGVCYRTLVGGEERAGWVTALPCLADKFARKPGDREIVPCEKFQQATYEEAAAEVDQRNAHIAEVLAKIEAGKDVRGVLVCGQRTQPEGKECPQSVDGKCPKCGGDLMSVYGLGSGYGGIGGYSVCYSETADTGCGEVCDFVSDEETDEETEANAE